MICCLSRWISASPSFQETEGNFYSYIWWTFSVTLLGSQLWYLQTTGTAIPMSAEQKKLTNVPDSWDWTIKNCGNALSGDTTEIECNF